MLFHDKAKDDRISIYVDCILGLSCAFIGITGFIIFGIPSLNSPFVIISISFWAFWIILCFIFIALGVSTHYANKKYDPNAPPRKDLKAPIVS